MKTKMCNIPKVFVKKERSDYKCLLGSSEVTDSPKINYCTRHLLLGAAADDNENDFFMIQLKVSDPLVAMVFVAFSSFILEAISRGRPLFH